VVGEGHQLGEQPGPAAVLARFPERSQRPFGRQLSFLASELLFCPPPELCQEQVVERAEVVVPSAGVTPASFAIRRELTAAYPSSIMIRSVTSSSRTRVPDVSLPLRRGLAIGHSLIRIPAESVLEGAKTAAER
jgi:hypothetical protein